jgi:hypothetical protein
MDVFNVLSVCTVDGRGSGLDDFGFAVLLGGNEMRKPRDRLSEIWFTSQG